MIDSWVLEHERRLKGKTVLVRVDHSLPINSEGNILDWTRLNDSIEGLKAISKLAKKTIILPHFGSPKGKYEEKFSTRRIFTELLKKIECCSAFCSDASPEKICEIFLKEPTANLIYTENVRFLSGELDCDSELSRNWGELADVYINDAFSVSHRRHASVAGISEVIDSYAGPILTRDLNRIAKPIRKSKRLGVIIGGAKSSTKLPSAINIAKSGIPVCVVGKCGVDIQDEPFLSLSRLHSSLTPLKDVLVRGKDNKISSRSVQEEIDDEICDTGPKSMTQITQTLGSCDLIVWNGPLGKYENCYGRAATNHLCRFLNEKRKSGVYLIAGGGDTCAFLNMMGLSSNFDTCITAGGALLAYIEQGLNMPGLVHLSKVRTSNDLKPKVNNDATQMYSLS